MGRNKKKRNLSEAPDFVGYMPIGLNHLNVESVPFLFEEFEAIKLADYEGKNFEEAAKCMDISKSTFGRIISQARKKIATAFVEIRAIRATVEDLVNVDNFRYCPKCFHSYIENKENTICPKCQNDKTVIILKQNEVQ